MPTNPSHKKTKNIPKLRFPGFSDSWEEKKLKEITNYVDYRGKAPPKSEKGVFLVTAKNIKKGNINYKCSKEYVPELLYNEVMKKGLPLIGDILFTTEAPLGNVAEVDNAKIALAQRVIKFRGTTELKNKFLLHYMLSDTFQKLIKKKAIGSTVLGIQGKVLHNLNLVIPQIEEQACIATFLTTVDEKIEKIREKKKLLEEYKKGMMQKIFSQELRFSGFHGAWEEKELGELCEINKGKQLNKDELIDDGKYPALNGGVNPSGYTNDFNRNENTITISEGGNSCGYVNYTKTKFRCGGHCYSLDELKDNHLYLFQTLKYFENNIMRLRVGSGLPNIQKKAINDFKIKLPSLPEQEKIADFLSAIDEKIEKVGEELGNAVERKKGLLQGLFV